MHDFVVFKIYMKYMHYTFTPWPGTFSENIFGLTFSALNAYIFAILVQNKALSSPMSNNYIL